MNMKYLGIDSGGTKTSFCLCDGFFNVLGEYEAEGCYYPVTGKEGITEILQKGIEMCIKKSGAGINGIKAQCGLPVYGELDSFMSDLPEIAAGLPIPVNFCNDAHICHAGALGGSPGITVIAGTGSIGFGVDETGDTARSGGFGPEIGGDEGSAHFIGLRLIQKFTRQSDLREERTFLYGEGKKSLGLKNDMDIYAYMIEKIKMNRKDIAALAVLADKTARLGDIECKKIFVEAAYELCLLAAAVKKQLNFENTPVKVSYTGGVYKAGDLILPELSGLLAKNGMALIDPKFPPVIGACILAKNSI